MDVCLIYYSSSLKLIEEKDFTNLLEQSRQYNGNRGITGVLLCIRGQIIQVLEGQQLDVEDLFNRIKLYPRHTNVSLALKRPISQRLFPTWTMGYETITFSQLEDIKTIINTSIEKES